eukprot:SAG31_NODE_770_length_12217_cov_2.855174_8_plen_634_part_00
MQPPHAVRHGTTAARWFGLVGLPALLSPLAWSADPAARCGFAVVLMALFWSLELLPVRSSICLSALLQGSSIGKFVATFTTSVSCSLLLSMQLPVTALLPVVLLPALGVLDTDSTCRIYMKATDMFYLGSLMVALGVEESGLHRRIALRALTFFGGRSSSIMFGFMLVTALLSMWISNAASTAMMVPILEAVLAELHLSKRETAMMMMSVAFSANIGGTGTIIGTPPNIILVGFLDERFGTEHPIVFGSWMVFAVPLAATNLLICWALLRVYFSRGTHDGQRVSMIDGRIQTRPIADGRETGSVGTLESEVCDSGEPRSSAGMSYEMVEAEKASLLDSTAGVNVVRQSTGRDRGDIQQVIWQRYTALGPPTGHEVQVLLLFAMLVALWSLRKPGFIPGWAEALASVGANGHPVVIDTASETIFITILLFVLPADWSASGYGPAGTGNKGLLDWSTVQRKFPWGIILVMGGGFALAEGAQESCLATRVGASLAAIEGSLPPFLLLLLLCVVTSGISTIASNSATTSMLVPVVLELAQAVRVNPIYLALGVTFTASQSFMLPVSTPPNAIVFTAGGLNIGDMAGVGGILNCLTILTTVVFIYLVGVPLFDLDSVPTWANVTDAQQRPEQKCATAA